MAKWYPVPQWSVRRLPFGLALKYTHNRPPLIEAENIQFVRHHTTIPVPRIFDILPGDERYMNMPDSTLSSGLIVMEWIEGQTLQSWISDRTFYPPEFHTQLAILEDPESSETRPIEETRTYLDSFEPELELSDGSEMMDELRQSLNDLRSLPPPSSGAISNPSGSLIWLRCRGNRSVLKPFEDVHAFHDFLLQEVSWKSRMPQIRKMAASVYSKKHRICFTHSDLNASNILVKDGRLAGIIDWELAGWYPEYWEYTMLQRQNFERRPLDIFWEKISVFPVQQYRDELALERALWRSTGDTSVPPGLFPSSRLAIGSTL